MQEALFDRVHAVLNGEPNRRGWLNADQLTTITACAKLGGTKISRQASSTSTDVRGDFLILAKSNITVSGAKGTVHGSNTDAGNPRRWCEMLGGTHVPSPLRVSYQRKVRVMPPSKKTLTSSARDPRLAPWVDPEPKRPQDSSDVLRQQLLEEFARLSAPERKARLAQLAKTLVNLEEAPERCVQNWLADTIGPRTLVRDLAIYQN